MKLNWEKLEILLCKGKKKKGDRKPAEVPLCAIKKLDLPSASTRKVFLLK